MSGPMNQAFGKMLAYGEESTSVRVIVVTGAEGAFCAGGDVKSRPAPATVAPRRHGRHPR